MRTMTWEEIDKDWDEVKRRCARYVEVEEAEAIAKYCIGHSIKDVATRINYHRSTVQERLDLFGVSRAQGIQGCRTATPSIEVSREQIRQILGKYGPTPKQERTTDFVELVDSYKEEGYLDSTALRLSRAEWAAEAAIESGTLKEDFQQDREKRRTLLFPEDNDDTWELRFRSHMAAVERAAEFLDSPQTKINYLRRKSTCERVTSAHAKWLEQVERVCNLHSKHLL